MIKPANEVANVLEVELDRWLGASIDSIAQIDVDLPQGNLHVWVRHVERLACEVDRIQLQSSQLATLSGPQAVSLANTISQELTYLEERIVPCEIDQVAAVGQLRSSPTPQSDRSRHYYEIILNRQGISLQRYAALPQSTRTPISATMTRPILVRVCRDLVRLGGGS